jgi:hypothetical protein
MSRSHRVAGALAAALLATPALASAPVESENRAETVGTAPAQAEPSAEKPAPQVKSPSDPVVEKVAPKAATPPKAAAPVVNKPDARAAAVERALKQEEEKNRLLLRQNRQMELLIRKLSEARTKAEADEYRRQIKDLKKEVADEKLNSVAVATGSARTVQWLKMQNVLVGISAGLLVILTSALAGLWWWRSRKLKADLAGGQPADPWRDCVLVAASGQAVKLAGDKLTNGGIIVGRSTDEADVLIDGADVSRRHARFEVMDGGLQLTDLGSTNKTRVNDTPLTPHTPRRLYEGDAIHLGSRSYHLRIKAPATGG